MSHDTHIGVASYKLVSNTLADHTEHMDVHEMQDLDHTSSELLPQHQSLHAEREEHTYKSPTTLINFHKSVANGEIDHPQENSLTCEQEQLLKAMRSVSVDEPVAPNHRQHVSVAACTSAMAAAVDELVACAHVVLDEAD